MRANKARSRFPLGDQEIDLAAGSNPAHLAGIRNRGLEVTASRGERRKIGPAALVQCQAALNAERNWGSVILLDCARNV